MAIALRLCATGPGLSIVQIHNAPKDSVSPRLKLPNCIAATEGSKIPADMRSPSEKYWL